MRKLAWAALSFSAAVFLSRYLLPASWLLYGSAACAVLGAAGFLFRSSARQRIVLAGLALAAGFVWTAFYTNVFLKPAETLDGVTETVSAIALSTPENTDYGSKLTVTIKQDGLPDVKTILYVFEALPEINAGNSLTFTARFKLADTVFGEETDGYFSKGIFLTAYAEGGIAITDRHTPLRYFPAYIADRSGQVVDRIFPNGVRGFMRALLLGDTSGVYGDPVLSSSMAAAGASHVVAVSGMHLAFLVGFVKIIVRKKRRLAAVAIPVILLFMAVVGFRPSLARAGIMQIFLLCAPLFKRENDVFTSLSASLMLILLINPYAAVSAGLQLSFAATLGLALYAEKLFTRLDEPLRYKKLYSYKLVRIAIRFIIGGLSSTLAALAFSVPLAAVHFGIVSIVAPLTNLLILLPVSLAFIGGMLALILGFIFAPAGIACAFIAALPVRWIIAVIGGLSQLPFAAVYTSNPAAVIWLIYTYAMLLALWLSRARLRQLLTPACLSAASLSLILVATSVTSAAGGFRVTALDVGQGQSIILTSGQYTAVVDCGSVSGKDAGDRLIRNLKSAGRGRIDLLVLTHFHTDHAGGVEEVLSRFPVTALAMPDPSTDGGNLAADIESLAHDKGIRTVYVTENLTASLGSMTLTLYAPVGTSDENERGVVILATQREFDALITGDISDDTERALLASAALPDIEVLVAGHHGSKYATSDELLDAVTPEAALISVGYNSYGHPSPETLQKLARSGILIYRTDLLGNVTVKARQNNK